MNSSKISDDLTLVNRTVKLFHVKYYNEIDKEDETENP